MRGLKKSRIHLLAIFCVAVLYASIDSYAKIIEDQSQLMISSDVVDIPIDSAPSKGETATALSSASAADSGGVEQSPAQKAAAQSSSGGSGSVTSDLFSGTMSKNIPIDVPPGRNGMEPKLSLLYRSSNGNGWVGMGWELEIGAIERSTKGAVKYDDNSDTFLFRMAGATIELVDISGNRTEFRSKMEGAFNRFQYISSSYWIVTDKKGTKYRFGYDTNSRQDDPENVSHIFKWCLDRVEDTDGNYMTFSYYKNQTESPGQIYLDQINYTYGSGLNYTNYVKFYRETRTDAAEMYTTNFKVKTVYRLKTVDVFANSNRVRKYELVYGENSKTKQSTLLEIKPYGKDGTTQLPSITMGYSLENISVSSSSTWLTIGNGVSSRYIYADFDGDGKTDALHIGSEGNQYVALSKGDRFEPTQNTNWLQIGNGDPTRYIYSDFNGDGKTDVLHVGGEGNQYVALSTGSNFSASSTWLTIGNGVSSRYIYADFNGDGKADVLHIGGEGNHYIALSQGNSFVPTNGTWLNSNWLQIGNGDPTRYKYADFNGDGKTDVLHIGGEGNHYIALSQGNSFVPTNGTWLNSNWLQIGNGDPARYRYVDFNGDGKVDVLHMGGEGNQYVSLSTGTQFKPTGTTWQTSNWLQIGNGDPARYRYADLNGDGKPDVLHIGVEGNQYVALSTGDQFKPTGATWQTSNWLQIGNGDPARYAYGDFNGAGKTDVLHIGGEGNQYVAPVEGMPANMLVQFSNGLGAMTTIAYTSSTQYANTQLPFPVQTVSSVATNDGNGNISTTSYTYSGGFFHIGEKDFRGFNHVTVTGPAADGKQAITETWFHQGDDVDVDANNLLNANGIELATKGYMKGKPYRAKVIDGSGNKYSETTTSYVSDSTSPYFNPPYQVDAYTCDGDACGKQTRVVYNTYDLYGNITQVSQYGDVNDSTDDSTVTKSYGYNTTAWIVGLPTYEALYEGIGASGTKKSETNYYYDGGVTDCNTASTNQAPTKGKLTRAVRWLSGGTNPETRMAYNSYGNLICSRDSNGNTTTIGYDATYTFPRVATNPIGHQATTQYYGVDGVIADKGLYGQVKSATDPNGAAASYEYDTFGRRTKVTNPDGSYATTSYNNFGTVGSQYIKTDTSAGLSSWTYFDGLGRTIIEKSTGPDSKTVAKKTVYDARGAVRQSSLPYFDGLETPKYSTFTYDPIGRTTRVDMPDGTRSLGCYNDWVAVSIDANNHRKRETRDTFGRLKQVEEYTSTFSICDTGADTPYATTTYQYDTLGNLRYVTDANGNQSEMRYDTLNRKYYMHDPDMGNWNYYYDNNGNMTSQVDSMGQWIYFRYDELNRLRQKDNTTQKPLGSGDVVYRYDETHTSYGKGRLTSMTDQSGSATYYYDSMGQTTRTDKVASGSTYTTQYGYDQLGRPNAVTYPDNATINYNYNGPLLSSAYEGSTTYAVYAGYNALGQPGSITYANGVVTNYTYSSSGNPTCTADNYRLCTINTAKSGNTYQNKRYAYDNVGNVSAFYDSINGDQSFTYDSINRLETVLSGAYGSITYAYDKIGNMTTNTQVGTYIYPTNGIRPHAVSTAGSNSYSYDSNGNMTSGAGRTITYDPENRPMTVTASGITTTFYYDGNGERVKKTSGGNTTVYIGKLYECTGSSCEKFIFANGQRIAKKTAGTGTIYYYHSDHLGSSSVVTDVSGNQAENLAYYPYGASRIDSAPSISHHKYTDQELDAETGLYFYNARYYDPVLGRFISADSIIPDPSDPQAFNRYSYASNNPLRYTDPSGHWSMDVGDWHISGSDKDIGTAAIATATAVATFYCGGCGVAVQGALYGALAGEVAGGGYAMATGGDVLEGVLVGGAIGGTLGYFAGPALADPQYAMVADGLNKTAAAPSWTLSLGHKATLGLIGAGGSYMAFSAIGGGRDGGGGGGGGIQSSPTIPVVMGPGQIAHYPADQVFSGESVIGDVMGMVGPMGAVGKITGFTRHGLNRAIQRGIKPSQILNAVKNPLTVSPKVDALGRASTEYVGREATAVLNSSGKVITTHGTHSNLVEKLLGGN